MLFRDMSVSDADFQRMVRFIQDNYGIDLSKKKQLITSRLSHSLRERGYPDFSAFLDHLLKKQDPADLELVLNKLTTNYTFFYAGTRPFYLFPRCDTAGALPPPSERPGSLHLERGLLQW